jgi:hypothetical protein
MEKPVMTRKKTVAEGLFRDPRGDKEQMSLQRDDTREVIDSYLSDISGAGDEIPVDFTDFRNLSRLYVQMITASYSLGDDPESLRQYVEPAVHWSLKHENAYHEKYPDATWEVSPTGAIDMAQLLSVAVLLGTDEQRARLSEAVSTIGPHTALEFLAGQHGDALDGVEIQLPHPRPYGRLIKVIQGEPEKRPKLMADFLKHWYAGCRKAQWWGGDYEEKAARQLEQKGRIFYSGYWCMEAAAATKLLNIDDTLYRDNEYYPQDLLPPRP